MAANTHLPNLAAPAPDAGSTSRRSFLRTSAVATSALAALAASLAPLRELSDFGSVEEFLQKQVPRCFQWLERDSVSCNNDT